MDMIYIVHSNGNSSIFWYVFAETTTTQEQCGVFTYLYWTFEPFKFNSSL